MNSTEDNLIGFLNLAVQYLEHPDVKRIPFAQPSEDVAKEIRRYIGGLK